jgi:dTDP-4-dehydrorhamnose reductase
LILGHSGQLAQAFSALLPDAEMAGRDRLDLAEPDLIFPFLDRLRPRLILNASAYTKVDEAEGEEIRAFRVNAVSPARIAAWAALHDAPLLHCSTDYVFGGAGAHFHQEQEETHPLNVYGRSKAAGEEAVAQAGGRHLIFRTSWLYDARGKNFFTTMLRLMQTQEHLRVVADQWGAPTYAPQLAEAALSGLKNALAQAVFPSGIYHLCHQGVTSWHGFAEAIREEAQKRGMALRARAIAPVSSAEWPTPARRPANSRLDCARAGSMLNIALPDWRAGLNACFEDRLKCISPTAP